MRTFKRFAKLELDNGRKYIFDKYIFQGCIAFLLLFTLSVFIYYGFDLSYNLYVGCKNMTVNSYYCENPLYMNYDYCHDAWPGACEQKFIPVGFEYGKPPPKILSIFESFTVLTIVLGFLINHFLYNKGKFKGLL